MPMHPNLHAALADMDQEWKRAQCWLLESDRKAIDILTDHLADDSPEDFRTFLASELDYMTYCIQSLTLLAIKTAANNIYERDCGSEAEQDDE